MKRGIFGVALSILGVFFILISCAEVVRVGTAVGEGMGKISKEDRAKIDRLALQAEKAIRPMSEQEEYYLGRAVAATILGQYRLYRNERLTRYLNEVGQAVALASSRPFTYGGYHFAVLDTDEVNALACPGGIIFVTRGMLKKAKNEEEVAAILAHEIAHVSHKHGLGAIQSSRWAEVVTALGTEAAKKLSGAELAKLVSLFEGSVNDVAKTLLVNGYSREQESAADLSALSYMNGIGYDPNGLAAFLGRLAGEQTAGANKEFFGTHPGMQERLSKAKSFIAEKKWTRVDSPGRNRRFQQFFPLS